MKSTSPFPIQTKSILFAVLLSLNAVLTTVGAAETGFLPGQMAPAFSLSNSEGKPIALADFRGKWVVLEWVNYDCPFVKKYYGSGNMQALQKDAQAQGLVWLSINSSADGKQGSWRGEELKEKIRTQKAVPSHYLIDADGKVGHSFEAKTTPTLVILDTNGVVAYRGAIDDKPSTDAEDIASSHNYVREALASIKAGKPLAATNTKSYGCSVKYAK